MIKNFINFAVALVVIGFVHVSLERSADGQRLFRNRGCCKPCASARGSRLFTRFSHRGRCCPSSSSICCATPMEGPCECVPPPSPCCGSYNDSAPGSNNFSQQDSGWVEGRDEDCQEQYDNCLKVCQATCANNMQACTSFCECQRKVCQGENLSCAAPACFDPNYQPGGPAPGGQ